jgi:ABC-type uncharacterized transport system permease subunit
MPSEMARLLTILSLAAYAAAALTTLVGLRIGLKRVAWGFLGVLAAGAAFNVITLAIRAARGHWPMASTFDTFSLLAMMLAVMSGYLKLVDRQRAAELVLLPAAAACAGLALCLSGAAYRDFAPSIWHAAHVVFAIAGTAYFAVAAGAGVIYLRTHRRLRRKDPSAIDSHWPSLERLDRFVRHAIPVGFALLTLTMAVGVYGGFLADRSHWVRTWWKHPKMLIAALAWCVYGVALHSAYGRRFRGRRAAVLSIAGLVLLVVVLLLSLLMPSAGGGDPIRPG